MSIPNTQDGFRSFEEWMLKIQEHLGTRAIVIGMEPTGHYWKPLAEWLNRRGYAALRLAAALPSGSRRC
ncbi:hypothetical protein D3C72_2433360 [compost metagenome]